MRDSLKNSQCDEIKQDNISGAPNGNFRENICSSGELRNGSSLHAGFYDLILFFPVSSFILLLDRCV